MVSRQRRGFTLVELLVVLTIIGTLLTWVGVRLNNKVEMAKEQTLRHNLSVMRECIDQFRADKGKYPDTLNDLVDAGYLKHLPTDPYTERNDSWNTVLSTEDNQSGIVDVHSGADTQASNGNDVSSW